MKIFSYKDHLKDLARTHTEHPRKPLWRSRRKWPGVCLDERTRERKRSDGFHINSDYGMSLPKGWEWLSVMVPIWLRISFWHWRSQTEKSSFIYFPFCSNPEGIGVLVQYLSDNFLGKRDLRCVCFHRSSTMTDILNSFWALAVQFYKETFSTSLSSGTYCPNIYVGDATLWFGWDRKRILH